MLVAEINFAFLFEIRFAKDRNSSTNSISTAGFEQRAFLAAKSAVTLNDQKCSVLARCSDRTRFLRALRKILELQISHYFQTVRKASQKQRSIHFQTQSALGVILGAQIAPLERVMSTLLKLF